MKSQDIIVVDDNKETLETICWMTKNMRLGNVRAFTNVDDTLAYLSEPNEVSLILCDWNMPEKTGLDLLRELRQEGNLIPFIMVTARSDVASVLEARQYGVDLYISKPFSTFELQQKVRWVNSHRDERLKNLEFKDEFTK